MSLIDEKDLEEFYLWAEKNIDKSCFPTISKEETSYYTDRNSEETYMMEYSFDTMSELRKMLEQYSGLDRDPEMLKKLTIAISQYGFNGRLEENEHKEANRKSQSADGKKSLPEYVYVF